MRGQRLVWAAVVGVVGGAASCAQLFGLDQDYRLGGAGGGGAPAGTGAGGTTASGGGSGTSSTTGASSSGLGGSGGAGGGSASSSTGGGAGGASIVCFVDGICAFGATEDCTCSDCAGLGICSGVGSGCTDAADAAIFQSKDVKGIAQSCGTQQLGQQPATGACIKAQTGLSDACVQCFVADIQCVVGQCISQCLSSMDACVCCDNARCQPAFVACSGRPLPPPPDGGCP
jgi:hypothetical protein